MQVLPIQVDIFSAPAFDVDVETSYVDEVGPVLAGHAETEISPEPCVFLDHQLLLHRWDVFRTSVDQSGVVLAEQHRVEYLFARLRVESAGVEEVSGEVDVHVTEEKQHVASLPGSGPDV